MSEQDNTTASTVERATGDFEDLVALEHRFWEAAGDGGFYERNMAADGRCLFAVGLLDRNGTLDAVNQSEPWSSFELDDLTVHELGLEGAAVSYRVVASRDGDTSPYRALAASTYRRAGGDWELVLHQQTRLSEGD